MNFAVLSEGEGWGIVAMFGLVSIVFAMAIIDFVLQLIIRNNRMLNLVGVGIILILVLALIIF